MKRGHKGWILGGAAAAALWLAARVLAQAQDAPHNNAPKPTVSAPSHTARVIVPEGLGRLKVKLDQAQAQPFEVRCATCHDNSEADRARPKAERADQLDEFHAGLRFEHGALKCGSCHDLAQRDRLHLATGELLNFERVMELCGQCHGLQLRDWQHGAHGGMQGYWDKQRGPQTRNHCLHCHDPHAPAYQGGQPAPGPRDRFLQRPGGDHE